MTPRPSGGGGSVPPVPGFDYAAQLVTDAFPAPRPGSWFVTHPLGRPAGGTYTEVAFGVTTVGVSDRVLEEVVRRIATDLYGSAWAFTYRPDQYDDAIARHRMRRRELVIVTTLTVYDREDPRP